MTEHDEHVERIWDELEGNPTWMFTTAGTEGLHARPMAVTADRAAGCVWLVTEQGSGKTAEVARQSDACLTRMDGNLQIAIAAKAERTDDRQKLREIWSPGTQAFFPGGPDDPRATLLKVTPTRAEIWDGDNSLVAAIKLAVAAAQKERPDLGDDIKVNMRRR